MHVLLVTQYFWPESFRINELVNAMQRTGIKFTVLTGQPNYPEGQIFKGYKAFSIKREYKDSIEIIRVPMVARGKSNAIKLALNYLSYILFASFLGPWLLRRKKFDTIFVYAPSPILQVIPAIIIKKIKKIPLITWVGDLWPESLVSTGFVKNKVILNLIAKLVSWIYKNNDLVLVQSQPFLKSVMQLAGNVPVRYFPNPGENSFANGKDPVLTLQGYFHVVFAGNLGSVQALNMVIDAATILAMQQDIRFVLIGNGSQSAWLKMEIEVRGLTNVLMPGRYPPEEMPAIFDQADALLVSLVRDETMNLTVPAKVQSYMAAGRPIIAALNGEGARIVIEAGAGVASPAEDAEELVKAVLKLKGLSRAELDEMGANGRVFYQKHYHPDVLAAQLSKWMAELRVFEY
jgi:glycosyltransferase involved in cell wall biosynthesis